MRYIDINGVGADETLLCHVEGRAREVVLNCIVQVGVRLEGNPGTALKPEVGTLGGGHEVNGGGVDEGVEGFEGGRGGIFIDEEAELEGRVESGVLD